MLASELAVYRHSQILSEAVFLHLHTEHCITYRFTVVFDLRFKLAYMEDTKRVMYLLPWPWIWSRKSLWRLVYPPLWTQLILILLDDLDHTQINMQPVAKFITKRLCCSQTSAKFNVPSTLVLIVSTLCDSHQSTLGLPVSNIENMVWFFVFGIVVAAMVVIWKNLFYTKFF